LPTHLLTYVKKSRPGNDLRLASRNDSLTARHLHLSALSTSSRHWSTRGTSRPAKNDNVRCDLYGTVDVGTTGVPIRGRFHVQTLRT